MEKLCPREFENGSSCGANTNGAILVLAKVLETQAVGTEVIDGGVRLVNVLLGIDVFEIKEF